MRRLAIEAQPSRLPGRRWGERFGHAAHAAAARRQQPPEAAAPARLPRPRRARAAGREPDRRGLEVEACALSPLGLTVRSGNAARHRGLPARRLLRAGRGEPGGGAAAAAGARASACSTRRRLPAARASRSWPASRASRLAAADAALEPRAPRARQPARGCARRAPLVVADARQPAVRRALRSRGARPALHRHRHAAQAIPSSSGGSTKRRSGASRIRRCGCSPGAAPLVRPGGLLVAITCSLEEEENERVGASFPRRRAGLLAASISSRCCRRPSPATSRRRALARLDRRRSRRLHRAGAASRVTCARSARPARPRLHSAQCVDACIDRPFRLPYLPGLAQRRDHDPTQGGERWQVKLISWMHWRRRGGDDEAGRRAMRSRRVRHDHQSPEEGRARAGARASAASRSRGAPRARAATPRPARRSTSRRARACASRPARSSRTRSTRSR